MRYLNFSRVVKVIKIHLFIQCFHSKFVQSFPRFYPRTDSRIYFHKAPSQVPKWIKNSIYFQDGIHACGRTSCNASMLSTETRPSYKLKDLRL